LLEIALGPPPTPSHANAYMPICPPRVVDVRVTLRAYILRPKIFTPLDFYTLHLTIRLIIKKCENVKTIMIYLKYIWW
jgi:hypothetical protein